ncbi:hypothetical protein JW851_02270, partial [Candidatus Woesearchaeota archaeon]|nr:hypothetical protein [Candidatus Woesearchaeota archaeon]
MKKRLRDFFKSGDETRAMYRINKDGSATVFVGLSDENYTAIDRELDELRNMGIDEWEFFRLKIIQRNGRTALEFKKINPANPEDKYVI